MPQDAQAELLALNQQLLNAIAQGDWETYSALCDPSLTAFEPEALGHLVEGMDFHAFYFKLSGGHVKPQNTMCDARVRLMGDVAIVAYYRLTQFVDGDGHPGTRGTEETRVWQRQNGRWRHVHFHRSPSQKT
jgi:calcium/calmodulin-dependent protein kinase (CaM kinase) II